MFFKKVLVVELTYTGEYQEEVFNDLAALFDAQIYNPLMKFEREKFTSEFLG